MPDFTCITNQIYEECIAIFRKYYQGYPVRKVYVGVSNLQSFDHIQLKMFDDYNQRDLKISICFR